MPIDPSRFHTLNVADTCSIWNVLSSLLLMRTAHDAGCSFCCTSFVEYECLHKPRSKVLPEDDELRTRLRAERERGSFKAFSLDVADLQEVQVLEARKRLSKGELSSIVFAAKTRQAFLTDDQKARKLADGVLQNGMVQTTPHLFSWLYFHSKLSDADKDPILNEHERLNRPLRKFFEESYLEALRCRLMQQTSPASVGSPPPDASSS